MAERILPVVQGRATEDLDAGQSPNRVSQTRKSAVRCRERGDGKCICKASLLHCSTGISFPKPAFDQTRLRTAKQKNLQSTVTRGGSGTRSEEPLSPPDRAREALLMGMRLGESIDLAIIAALSYIAVQRWSMPPPSINFPSTA